MRHDAVGGLATRTALMQDAVWVQMRDGARLATDVYLPPAWRRGPVVLIRTPYGRRSRESSVLWTTVGLCLAGWAVVVQDVRGLGDSTGSANPFVHEVEDARSTLDWLARQRWADGRVACWGSSYYGFTAWAAVATRHPAVCALVSRMSSPWPEDFTWQNGVLRLGPMVDWARSTWGSEPIQGATTIDWSVRPWAHLLGHSRATCFLRTQPFRRESLSSIMRAAVGAVPTLHWVGWFDLFSAQQLALWQGVKRNARHQYLVATASDHMDYPFLWSGVTPDPWQDDAACQVWLARTLKPVLVFLQAMLGRSSSRPLDRVEWELSGVGMRKSSDWPPSGSRRVHYYLGLPVDGGPAVLRATPALSTDVLCWDHNPANPVPTVASDWWRPLRRPEDARALARHPDVLSFTSPPAPVEGRQLAGPVYLILGVQSSCPGGIVVATLCDVRPDGESRVLLHMPQTLGREHELLRIYLGDIGYQQAAGNRLQLHLASSSFPLYALPVPTGADPWDIRNFPSGRQTVSLAESYLQIQEIV